MHLSLQVWDWGGNGYVRFSAEDTDRQTMGSVVENAAIQSALLQRLSELRSVELLAPVRSGATPKLGVKPGSCP